MFLCVHNLYTCTCTPYDKQCNLLLGTLQASTNLCKHDQKEEEAYTKKIYFYTLLKGNQRSDSFRIRVKEFN